MRPINSSTRLAAPRVAARVQQLSQKALAIHCFPTALTVDPELVHGHRTTAGAGCAPRDHAVRRGVFAMSDPDRHRADGGHETAGGGAVEARGEHRGDWLGAGSGTAQGEVGVVDPWVRTPIIPVSWRLRSAWTTRRASGPAERAPRFRYEDGRRVRPRPTPWAPARRQSQPRVGPAIFPRPRRPAARAWVMWRASGPPARAIPLTSVYVSPVVSFGRSSLTNLSKSPAAWKFL